MRCPLKMINHPQDADTYGDCITNNCAWWDEYYKSCCVNNIAFHLLEIEQALGRLNN